MTTQRSRLTVVINDRSRWLCESDAIHQQAKLALTTLSSVIYDSSFGSPPGALAAMKATSALLAIAAFSLGGLVSAYALLPARSISADISQATRPVWREVAWPFPLDQWGKGKAFRCGMADCGADVIVYVRAKIGFCNCTTGIADDEELDRISDFELLSGHATAQGPGRPVAVGWMKGRSRPFAIDGMPQSALSIGLNDHCDAIVATAVIGGHEPSISEGAVIDFLNSETMTRWAQVALGL